MQRGIFTKHFQTPFHKRQFDSSLSPRLYSALELLGASEQAATATETRNCLETATRYLPFNPPLEFVRLVVL